MAVVTYVDRRDTLNRLARVGVVGAPAAGWLDVLNPTLVRQWSDRQLGAFVGSNLSNPTWPIGSRYPWSGLYPNAVSTPPPFVVDSEAWGGGTWGSGPWGD